MASTTGRGRPSIFPGKYSGGRRIQASISQLGSKKLDDHRKALAKLYKEHVGPLLFEIADGDVIEYLSRGEADTVKFLKTLAGGR